MLSGTPDAAACVPNVWRRSWKRAGRTPADANAFARSVDGGDRVGVRPALRHEGSDGTVLEWSWENSWHHAVVVDGDLLVGWTARQFDVTASFPEVTTRSRKDLVMLNVYGSSAGALRDPDHRFFGLHVDSWEVARGRILATEMDRSIGLE